MCVRCWVPSRHHKKYSVRAINNLKISCYPSLLSVAGIKHHNQKQIVKTERVYLAYRFYLMHHWEKEVRAETQDWN